MNDSISISSSSFSNSSSSNSKSNSLNRSELNNTGPFSNEASFTLADMNLNDTNNNSINALAKSEKLNNTKANNNNCNQNNKYANDMIDNCFSHQRRDSLPVLGTSRRRSKSQVLFSGDDLNTLTEQNKLLIEDMYYLKKTLKGKDEKINELNDIRDRLESEMHELSASLFEQAYTMVNTAKAETAQAEKLLKEANGKIDVLQAEVKALKEVVMTTNNSSNKNLHPYFTASKQSANTKNNRHIRQSSLNQQSLNQLSKLNLIPNKPDDSNLIMPSISCSNTSLNKSSSSISGSISQKTTALSTSRSEINFQNTAVKTTPHVKTHKRGLSHNDIQLQPKASFMDKLFNHSSSVNQEKLLINSMEVPNEISRSQQSLQIIEPEPEYEVEFNEQYFKEISEWRESPDLKEDSEFMQRIYNEDIRPCLNFNDENYMTDKLLESIRSNCVCIEDLIRSQLDKDSLPNTCGLSANPAVCEYKIRLNENESWIFISKLSRNRVISVCDFFTYLRYIKDGLVKCDINEIYWNIIDLRKKICLSRLGL